MEISSLNGRLSEKRKLKGSLRIVQSLAGKIVLPQIIDEADPYEGNYSVTPSAVASELKTAGKKMTSNLTVKPIPYYEVSNNSQGITAIIGG